MSFLNLRTNDLDGVLIPFFYVPDIQFVVLSSRNET